MPDYSKSVIYRIVLENDSRVYIGSTTNSLCRRMTGHRDTFKRWIDGRWSYCSSYELFMDGIPRIELVEEFPCNSRAELHKREGEIIRATANCVNKLFSGRPYKEWYAANRERLAEKQRMYRDTNSEEIAKRQKEYREANLEKLREYSRQYAAANREKKREYDRLRRTEQKDAVNQRQRENYAKRKAKEPPKLNLPNEIK